MMKERPVEFNSFTFNDRSMADFQTTPFYYVPLTSADGLFGNEIRFESHEIAGSIGSRSAPPLQSGKQIVLTGEIWAQNLYVLRTGEFAMQEAFWTSSALPLYFQPWVVFVDSTLAMDSPLEQLYFTVMVNQPLVITDEFTASNGQMKQLWTVGLHADDPRPYKKSDDALYFSWQGT